MRKGWAPCYLFAYNFMEMVRCFEHGNNQPWLGCSYSSCYINVFVIPPNLKCMLRELTCGNGNLGRLCCLVKQTFSVDNISVCICEGLLFYPPVLYAALLCAQTLDRRFRGMLRLECESKDKQHDCISVSSYSALQNVLQLQCPQLLGLFTLHGGDFANVGLCVF